MVVAIVAARSGDPCLRVTRSTLRTPSTPTSSRRTRIAPVRVSLPIASIKPSESLCRLIAMSTCRLVVMSSSPLVDNPSNRPVGASTVSSTGRTMPPALCDRPRRWSGRRPARHGALARVVARLPDAPSVPHPVVGCHDYGTGPVTELTDAAAFGTGRAICVVMVPVLPDRT